MGLKKMNAEEMSLNARSRIQLDSKLVEKHLDYLIRMIAIDSRSFGVGEFVGDRRTLPDMSEILTLTEEYLLSIGFTFVKVNQSSKGEKLPNPILMAEIESGPDKPTLLFYAHLDKQPYMDDELFERWDGYPPTEARWNKDKTRLYGRGAADDLAGVTAIGMTVDALLQALNYNPKSPKEKILSELPCNIKVIYETEEESGSHTLIEQIVQNIDFFQNTNCVLITDVINPAQGMPGLTTSLRGIVQFEVELVREQESTNIDAQVALYKLISSLIKTDHSLGVEAIGKADISTTDAEEKGYDLIPTTIETLRENAGLLPGTRLIVPENKVELVKAQLRRSFINVRPGNRISGSIIFGGAGARLSFDPPKDFSKKRFLLVLKEFLQNQNSFQLKLKVQEVQPLDFKEVSYDILLQSAIKNPHSGVHGGPFPVPELQLAKMINALIENDGTLNPNIFGGRDYEASIRPRVVPLFVDGNLLAREFDKLEARAIIEIRLAPGNTYVDAQKYLREHLKENVLPGFKLKIEEDKGASPWFTNIINPVYPMILKSLEIGYGKKPCIYGCGGSIPFVPKLMDALDSVPAICLGAYDPDSKMHEPGESMSLEDWLGCTRSMIDFVAFSKIIFKT